ncbi:MAG: DUF4124 domain-containing protein [Rubrivivax sp.]
MVVSYKVNLLKSIFRVAASVIAAVLTLAAPLAKASQIYKCTGSDGSIEFSNLTCPPGTAVSTFAVKPNFVDVSDMRGSSRPAQQQPQDEIVEAGNVSYTGAVQEVIRRDDAMRGGDADSTVAERIRVARDADVQRRSRLPVGADRKP